MTTNIVHKKLHFNQTRRGTIEFKLFFQRYDSRNTFLYGINQLFSNFKNAQLPSIGEKK